MRQDQRLDPIRLSKSEDNLVNKVRQNISCDVDIKTNVITISVKDQDPYVCAQIADSARVRLQEFITSYRTSKTRIDEAYYRQLTDSAMCEYNNAMKAYTQFCDAHQNMVLQTYLSERDELEKEKIEECQIKMILSY